MSAAKTHIQSIVTAVESLGYVFTDEFFDFETVPVSGDDEVYRLQAGAGELGNSTGSRLEKQKSFDIWVAFKLLPASDRKLDFYDVLDAVEDLEDAILQADAAVEVRIVENTVSAVISDYIIVKLSGELIYWRDLT